MKKLLLALSFFVSTLFGANYPFNETVTYNIGINEKLNSAGIMNQLVSALADQLSQNKDFLNNNTPIAITSIVALDDLKQSSKFGNVISENLIHEMQVRGFNIIDYKTMTNIEIKDDGDYIFSRIIEQLDRNHTINLVLSGTYTKYRDGYAINCRIVDIFNHTVKSTAQVFLPTKIAEKLNPPKVILEYKNIEKLVYPSVPHKKVKLIK